jgi:phage repressor protein C with HTH and peptisase S24 domain
MARRAKPSRQQTGLYYAREARGMSRSKLVELSGVSKQQLSRLENGQIRLRLDHLKPFAAHLGYTPEQILLWGRFPGTGANQIGSNEAGRAQASQEEPSVALLREVPELEMRTDHDGGVKTRKLRKEGRHTDPVRTEGWVFPPSFVREQLHAPAERLLVLGVSGDSMVPTLTTGDRVIIDTGHKSPTPDGLYAIRDAFEGIVVKRLQLLRSARPPRVKIISDNANHATEEVPLNELEIVGKALCYLKLL